MELMGSWFPGIMNNSCSKTDIVDGYIYESEDEFDEMNAQLSCLKWLKNKESDQFTGKAKIHDCGSNAYFFIMVLM